MAGGAAGKQCRGREKLRCAVPFGAGDAAAGGGGDAAQALNALAFLMREALGKVLGDFSEFEQARPGKRLPVVLSKEECHRLLGALEATPRLMGELMYGSGVRLMELLRLRIKDVDVERRQLVVRAGKGGKDRVTVLPKVLLERLQQHRERLRLVACGGPSGGGAGRMAAGGVGPEISARGQGLGMAMVFSVAGAFH
jgi:integrase